MPSSQAPSCPLMDLPTEIILKIADYLNSKDLSAFLRTACNMLSLLDFLLWKRVSKHARHDGKSVLEWAAQAGREILTCRLFKGPQSAGFSIQSRSMHQSWICFWIRACDLGATTSLGETALHFAVGNDSHSTRAVVDLLPKRGADTSVRSGADDGHPLRTSLYYAAMNGNEDYARSVMTHGADITACDYAGQPPYIWHLRLGTIHPCLLLGHGANPTTLDHSLCPAQAQAYAESWAT